MGECLALSVHSNSSQRCSLRLRSGTCIGQSSSSTPRLCLPCLYEPCSTLGTLQSTSIVLLATAKPRLLHQIARWRGAIHHSRELFLVLYTTASDALHCTWWCMAAARPWKPIPWCTVLQLIRRPHEVWRFVAIDSAESWRPLRTMHLSMRWPHLVFWVYHFMAKLPSFPNTSMFLQYSWQLTVEYLEMRKWHNWIC